MTYDRDEAHFEVKHTLSNGRDQEQRNQRDEHHFFLVRVANLIAEVRLKRRFSPHSLHHTMSELRSVLCTSPENLKASYHIRLLCCRLAMSFRSADDGSAERLPTLRHAEGASSREGCIYNRDGSITKTTFTCDTGGAHVSTSIMTTGREGHMRVTEFDPRIETLNTDGSVVPKPEKKASRSTATTGGRTEERRSRRRGVPSPASEFTIPRRQSTQGTEFSNQTQRPTSSAFADEPRERKRSPCSLVMIIMAF